MEIIFNSRISSVGIGKGCRQISEDFKISIDGETYTIPSGFVWDGASVPKVFWAKYGHPFDEHHEIPSLVHDAIYSGLFGTTFTRKEADKIYRALLRMQGASWWQATKEYYAVRWFGGSHFVKIGPMATIAASVLLAIVVSGCATKNRSVEVDGMFTEAGAGLIALGSVDVMAAPVGEETAFIKYEEDNAWLDPSMKKHNIEIMLTGTNSVEQVDSIVKSICDAFVKTANSKEE